MSTTYVTRFCTQGLYLALTSNLVLVTFELKTFLECRCTVNEYVDVVDDKGYHVTGHAELHHTATGYVECFPLHQFALEDHGEQRPAGH